MKVYLKFYLFLFLVGYLSSHIYKVVCSYSANTGNFDLEKVKERKSD